MADLVIDTNVALSLYLNQDEPSKAYSKRVFNAIIEQGLVLHVPPHFDIEFGAVSLKHLRNPNSGFSKLDFQIAIDDFETLEIHVDNLLINFVDVVNVGLTYNLSGYDANFFHVAKTLGCPIATHDRAIIGACQRFGVEWFNPD